MAYILQPEEQNQLQPGTAMQAGPAPSAPSTQKQAGPSHSGSWTNLNQYLQNQGQINQTAQSLVGTPDTKSKEAQTAIEGAQKSFQNTWAQPVTTAQKTTLQNTLTQSNPNVTEAKNIISSIQNFQPKQTEVNTASYQQQYDAAKAANEAKQKSIQEQLEQQYGGRGTVGKRALDMFAIGGTQGAQQMIENAKTEATKRQQALDALVGKNADLKTQGLNIQKQNQDWLNTMKQKAGQTATSITDNIKANYATNKNKLDSNIAAANAVRNGQMISEQQAKDLGIDWHAYQKEIKANKFVQNQIDKFKMDAANQNMMYANNAISSLMAQYGVDLTGWNPFDKNPGDPVAMIQQQNGVSREEAQRRWDLIWANHPSAKQMMATPWQDIPQLQNYLSQRGTQITPSVTDPNAFVTAPQAQQYNAINNIWGLGNTQLTAGSPNQYGYKYDNAAYTKALEDYLTSHYGNKK